MVSEVKIVSDGTRGWVEIDGVQQEGVMDIRLDMGAGEFPRVVIEYACYEHLTFVGGSDVKHFCPLGGVQ